MDAYIASEDGQATLQGCGVSGLVPLATAIQRLADNDINITVHDDYLYYLSDIFGAVNKQGQLLLKNDNMQYLRVTEDADILYATWNQLGGSQESYLGQHGACYPDSYTATSVTYDGRLYNFSGDPPVLNPQLPTYSD